MNHKFYTELIRVLNGENIKTNLVGDGNLEILYGDNIACHISNTGKIYYMNGDLPSSETNALTDKIHPIAYQVHEYSMAHGLGALYDTTHGVANAILLPTIMEYNAECTGDKYRDIAKAMGVENTDAMSIEDARIAACEAVKALSADVGIPADLTEIVKEEDVQFLAESAFADACRPGNPRDTSEEEIAALYRSLV